MAHIAFSRFVKRLSEHFDTSPTLIAACWKGSKSAAYIALEAVHVRQHTEAGHELDCTDVGI